MSEKQNFFSKLFNYVENIYYKFSDWITKKGINLNSINEKLEDKGIPPVAVFGGIFLIIILILIFLLIGIFSPKVSLEFNIYDYSNFEINDVYLKINSVDKDNIFSGNINNKDVITNKKLKIGKVYSLKAEKEGYVSFSKEFTIISKNDKIIISFDEIIEYGSLKLIIYDSDNKKIIPNSIATISYKLNGQDFNQNFNSLEKDNYNIILDVPLNKTSDILIKADNYEDFVIRNFKLINPSETKEINLVISSDISFSGKSDVIFIVNDISGNLINDAIVDVYNLEGNLIDTTKTIDGKALIKVNSGETINFSVSKEGYRTNFSDNQTSYRILELEKIIPIILEVGGSSISLNILDLDQYIPLEDSKVTIYDLNNNVIDTNITDFSGKIIFSGLENDSNIIVSACKDSYLCSVKKISLKEKNQEDIFLEKIKIDNSSLLNIFVVDSKNLPVSSAKIRIYKIQDELILPYSEIYSVDLTGSLSIPLENFSQFAVEVFVGDLTISEYITISDYLENKIIFVIDKADILVDLEILNKDGSLIDDGHLTIRTKDNTVLFDDDLNQGRIFFNNIGYSEFFADYYDENGNITTIPFSLENLDEDGFVSITITNPENDLEGNYPIIEFVEIKDSFGKTVNFLSEGKDYYLIFDVFFPKNVKEGGVHIRAGDDLEIDSENMSYGISGFLSDSTDFRYSTTYNYLPEPGNQDVDFLNEGKAGQINKWVELYWKQSQDIGTKQIKIKVNVVNTSKLKAIFEYRVWDKIDNSYYRDPIDSVLLDKKSNSSKQFLYAESKNIEIDVFDIPLNCKDEVCVSYKFISEDGIDFDKDNFIALKDEIYALEATFFSFKNTTINFDVSTSNTKPIISFISTGNNFSYPTNINLETISQYNITQPTISLDAGIRKKVYVFFIAKNIGISYIDTLIYSDSLEGINERINFDIFQKRNMNVLFTPDYIVSYGSDIKIEVFDSTNGNFIENAFIKIEDEYNQLISSFQGNNLNGKKGVYKVKVDFVVNKINVTVSAYGYKPYTREILIADDGVLNTPKEILINLGNSQSSEIKSFFIENLSDTIVTDISFGEPIWIEQADSLSLDIRGPVTILKNTNTNFEIIATASKDSQFTSAIAKIPIYGLIGNRQVAKLIPVRIIKGLVIDDCLVIKPEEINTYVGINNDYSQNEYFSTDYTDFYNNNYESSYNSSLGGQTSSYYGDVYQTNNNINYYSDGFNKYYSSLFKNTKGSSQNTVGFTIYNSCEKAVTINPELILEKTNSNNELDIVLTDVTVLSGEEILYNIIIENNSDRTQKKTYNYNILWNNDYYSLSPTKLNVELLDLSNSLWVTPQIVTVPMTQVITQQQAITTVRFWIKNIGNIPISNIQLSKYPERVSSNMAVTEYPREIEILEPGKMVPIDLKFQVSMNKSTFDDMYFVIKGTAAGVRDPIVSYIKVVFLISSPNCLKISPQKLSYNLNIGERRSKNITITNNCAEPVTIIGIDKSRAGYFETFGNNLISIYPTSGYQTIPLNGMSQFALDLYANDFKLNPSMPVTIVGQTTSGGYVSSESILTSINIYSEDQDNLKDIEQTKEIEISVCQDPNKIELITFPIISSSKNCSTNGYCDASAVSKLILEKINELYSEILQVSAHSQNILSNTSCSTIDAAKGFCSISDLGSTLEPIEFTFYMQNDYVSDDLLYNELKNTNYKFNKYMVDVNPYTSTPKEVYGLYNSGNRIFFTNGIKGCGRYTIEVDGFVAANNEHIFPDRVYFYVNLIEYKQTDQCVKNISNFLNFIPWDLDLTNKYNYGTWLTLFTGEEEISKGVIDSLNYFKDTDNRFIFNSQTNLKNNILKSSIDKITENKEALAKISFYDYSQNLIKGEQINLIINNKYENFTNNKLPEKVVSDSVKIISRILAKEDFAKLCITEDRKSLLVLELIEAGELKFKKDEFTIPINNFERCQDLEITSGIDERVSLSVKGPNNLDVYFKDNNNNILENVILDIVDKNYSKTQICFVPLNSNINAFVEKDIIVTANSIYKATGELSLRKTEAIIHLSSCGITPLDVLEKTSELIENYDNQNKEINLLELYALVDWQNSYSNLDSENICEVIRKYNINNPDAIGFYEYASLDCDIDITSSQEKARIQKYTDNAEKYFVGCMASCSACTAAVDGILLLIPIAGQVKFLKDILIDCGIFSCGIPSIGILLNGYTSEGLDVAIDKFIMDILPVGDSFRVAENISGFFDESMSVISGVFAGIRLNRTRPIGTSSQTISLLDDLPTVVVPNPVNPVNPVVPNIRCTQTTHSLDEYLRATFDNLHNNKMYISSFANGSKIKYINSTIYSDAEILNIIRNSSILKNSGTLTVSFDYTKINTSADLDEFKKIVGIVTGGNNNFRGVNVTGSLKGPDEVYKSIFNSRNGLFLKLENRVNILTASAGASSAGSSINSSVKQLTQSEYDDLLNNISTEKTILKNNLDTVENEIKKLEHRRHLSNVEKKTLDDFKKSKDVLNNLNKDLTDLEHIVQRGTPTGTGATRVYTYADDVANDYSRLISNVNNTTNHAVRRGSRLTSMGAGLLRGIGCGIIGNIVGSKNVRTNGAVLLNNSISIIEPVDFSKNILYQIVLEENNLDDSHGRYILTISPTVDTNITSDSRLDNCSIVNFGLNSN
ncbi:MAG: hypothetical protein PHN22_02795 [Candidatus ainarchaeum sp.]|nr:hypothetical protein [Candidatus ainarchaeum sp.]